MTMLFGPNVFKKLRLLDKVGKNLKYIKYKYMTHMEHNPCCEWPPYIPIPEWENLKKDANERSARLANKMLPPEERRYVIILRMKLCIDDFFNTYVI